MYFLSNVNFRLASKMYSETKGERTYMLNKMGALCFSLLTHSFINKPDPTDLIGTVISRNISNFIYNCNMFCRI